MPRQPDPHPVAKAFWLTPEKVLAWAVPFVIGGTVNAFMALEKRAQDVDVLMATVTTKQAWLIERMAAVETAQAQARQRGEQEHHRDWWQRWRQARDGAGGTPGTPPPK